MLILLVHLQHETTQCFIKQARDFCILVSERCEVGVALSCAVRWTLSDHVTLQPKKMVLTGRSVETLDCPPDTNLHRGKVCALLVVFQTALECSSLHVA